MRVLSLVTILCLALPGCSLAGLTTRPPTLTPPESPPAPVSQVTDVVTWGLAVVVGSLVFAFAARTLNGRQKTIPGIPATKKTEP